MRSISRRWESLTIRLAGCIAPAAGNRLSHILFVTASRQVLRIEAYRVVARMQDIQASFAMMNAVNKASHPDVSTAKTDFRIAIRHYVAGILPASACCDASSTLEPFHDQGKGHIVRHVLTHARVVCNRRTEALISHYQLSYQIVADLAEVEHGAAACLRHRPRNSHSSI